jgi:hypothetical protein
MKTTYHILMFLLFPMALILFSPVQLFIWQDYYKMLGKDTPNYFVWFWARNMAS